MQATVLVDEWQGSYRFAQSFPLWHGIVGLLQALVSSFRCLSMRQPVTK